MRKAIEVVLAVLGCEVAALVVGFILAGIGESGVIAMQITHVLFWMAFITSVVAAPLAAWVFFKSIKHAIAAFVLTAIIMGGGLWWLDGKLSLMKAAQDAANKPPPPLPGKLVNIPGPRVPIVKTPKSWIAPPAPTNQISGNGNVVGNTVKGNNNALIGNLQQGPGSIAQFGGSNNTATIYNRSNAMRISEEKKKELMGVLSGETATINIELCNGGNAGLALDIRDVFKAAGWDVGAGSFSSPCKSVVADIPGPEPADGKIIIYPNTPVSKIRDLMKAIGLESHIHQGPTLFNSYMIMVGTDSN